MSKISVGAAQSLAAMLGQSTDPRVREFATALKGEASAAAAAGNSDFDLEQPATATYQAARDALAAAIRS